MPDYLSMVTTEHLKRGAKTVLSGSEGVGKTSTAAHLQSPVFLFTPGEQSLSALQHAGEIPATPCFPVMDNWTAVMEAVAQLAQSEKVPGTLVIDALDGVEGLCVDHIIKEKFAGNRKEFLSYGQGWPHVSDQWRYLQQQLDEITKQGTHVVLLAHLEVKRFIAPDSSDYDRWQPACNKAIWSLTSRWADNIFMLTYLQHIVDGERNSRGKARGTSERIVYCTPGPARVCKNRSGLQESYSLGTSAKAASDVIKEILAL